MRNRKKGAFYTRVFLMKLACSSSTRVDFSADFLVLRITSYRSFGNFVNFYFRFARRAVVSIPREFGKYD